MHALRKTVAIGMAAAGIAAGCGPKAQPTTLSPGESALVDLYVQLAMLERQHTDHPDSVDAVLDSLWAAHDSLAVVATLRGLEAAPERWEAVLSAIDARLQELQADARQNETGPTETHGGILRMPHDSLRVDD